MHDSLVYEHPLSEKLRNWLRLEFLLEQIRNGLANNDRWSRRQCLMDLNELAHSLARSEVKAELQKDVSHYVAWLNALAEHPEVDAERQQNLQQSLNDALGNLRRMGKYPGQSLRNNAFLSNIRQRASIPGGACDFDLPALHQWLASPVEIQAQDLESWYASFQTLSQALTLLLSMIRDSDKPVSVTAARANFHQPLDKDTQLLRIFLPKQSPYYPEISGGRHRISLRFVHYSGEQQRPIAAQHDVPFQISYCSVLSDRATSGNKPSLAPLPVDS